MADNDLRQVSRRTFATRSALTVLSTALVSRGANPALARTGSVKQRRSIEEFPELDNYLHALNVLKNRPQDHPQSYFRLAQIHNSTSLRCEHGRSLFLPWHRALLFFFEQALQEADPPRTSNVTIPYYDFTRLPRSGRRYPAAFEDPSTILSQIWTVFGWEPSNRESARINSPFFTDASMRRLVTNNPNWNTSNTASDGSINGFGGLTHEGKGSLEVPSHDAMHSTFIGGQMAFPPTAADDPIFWSFHAFIDLVWHRWQQAHPNSPIDSLSTDLRGMPSQMTVEDVIAIRDLHYDYQDTPPPAPQFVMLADSGSYAQQNPHVAELAGKDDTIVVATIELTIPKPSFSAAVLVLPDFRIPQEVNYRGYVYLHPKAVPYQPRDDLFRERYLADFFAVLSMQMMPKQKQPMTTAISFQLGGALARLAESVPDQNYVITVAVSAKSVDEGRVLPKGERAFLLNEARAEASVKLGKPTLDVLR